MKNLSFIGAGYVGLCNGVGFTILGYKVTVVDIDEEKVRIINSGLSPIYEEGLEKSLKDVLNSGLFKATTIIQDAIDNSEVTFLCVQTPQRSNGSIDLKYVIKAAKEIGKCLRNKNWHLVVIKSTVVPSTTEEKIIPILEKYSGKSVGEDFGVCNSPEFLSEGDALNNFFNPDRIIIGEYDEKSGNLLEEVYSCFDKKIPRLIVDMKTAEMIKYASNAFIGMKISFANEIGNISKLLGIDGRKVMDGVGLDHRFSRYFNQPGLGFGGPCIKKDILALINEARSRGYDSRILKNIIEINNMQTDILLQLIKIKIRDNKFKTVGILGLSYKENVSDIRGSSSIKIISELNNMNVNILAYDPKVEENMRKLFPKIDYKLSGQEVIDNSDLIIILTKWMEFSELNYTNKSVIDGKGVISKEKCKEYEGICW